MGLDAESDQRADGEPESDSEEVVNGTGAHGECSGLNVAKVIGIHTDSAKERREGANVDAPVVRAVCACVDRAGLAFRAIEEVVREDARVNHGKGSDDGRIRRSAGLTLDDEFGVALAVHVCSDTGELNLGAVCHGCANECRHGAGEGADVNQAGLMPLLQLADFTLF
jgi:hypothetical protein